MKLVIDRFEGNYAVCETEEGKMINIEIQRIPSGSKEGDILIMDSKGIFLDTSRTAASKSEIDKLMDEIWEKNI